MMARPHPENLSSLGMACATVAAGGLLLTCLLSPCWADEVQLRNGDRLTGTIMTMEDEILTLNTEHSGEVKIQWPKIQSLSADTPLTIQLHDKVEETDWTDWLYSHYATVEAGRIGVDGPLTLDSVKAINPPPPIRYQGTLNVGGNRTQGNTETQAVNASTRWTVRSDRHRMLAEGKFNYGEVGNQVTVRNSLASLKYDFFLSKKIFTNAEGLLEKDTFQNLVLRTTLGSGLGYQFMDTQRATVSVVTGLAYVSEHYTNAPSVKTPAARWGLRTEFTLVPDRVKLFHKHEGFYDFGERGAMRVFADQGLRVTLIGNLFVNVEYDLRYNGAPAPGRRRTDEAMIIGVGYEFKR
jgi:putative salt-induced outer membrane protein YdiY